MDKQEILRSLAKNAVGRRYGNNECIFKEGTPPVEGLGFVLSGSVRILRQEGPRTVQLGTVQAGQFFGETALVLGRPRGATVLSDSEATVILFMDQQDFIREARQNHNLVRLLTQESLERLGRVSHLLFRQAGLLPFVVDPSLIPLIQDLRSQNPGMVDLVNNTRSMFVNAGGPAISQGERNDGQALLVTEGHIQLVRNHHGRPIVLHTLQAGDLLPPLSSQLNPVWEYGLHASPQGARILAFEGDVLFRIMGLNHRLFLSLFQSTLVLLTMLDDTLEQAVRQGQRTPGA